MDVKPFLAATIPGSVSESPIIKEAQTLLREAGLFHGEVTWHAFLGGVLLGVGAILGSIMWSRLARSGKLPAWSIVKEPPPKDVRFPLTRSPSLVKLWLRHRQAL